MACDALPRNLYLKLATYWNTSINILPISSLNAQLPTHETSFRNFLLMFISFDVNGRMHQRWLVYSQLNFLPSSPVVLLERSQEKESKVDIISMRLLSRLNTPPNSLGL